jgi:hypothetical protein
MMWQLTFEHSDPINLNKVQIIVNAKSYDEGFKKALTLGVPYIDEDNLYFAGAIDLDEVDEKPKKVRKIKT